MFKSLRNLYTIPWGHAVGNNKVLQWHDRDAQPDTKGVRTSAYYSHCVNIHCAHRHLVTPLIYQAIAHLAAIHQMVCTLTSEVFDDASQTRFVPWRILAVSRDQTSFFLQSCSSRPGVPCYWGEIVEKRALNALPVPKQKYWYDLNNSTYKFDRA